MLEKKNIKIVFDKIINGKEKINNMVFNTLIEFLVFNLKGTITINVGPRVIVL